MVGNLPEMRNRRPMQAYLSDEARDGWDSVALEQGATLTALCEALGLAMADGWRPSKRVIARARAIDRERYSRRDN